MSTNIVPEQRSPQAEPCFICGGGPHARVELHDYWPTSAAFADAEEYDRRAAAAGATSVPTMTAIETLDPREAVWL